MGIFSSKSKKERSRVTEHDKAVLVRYGVFDTTL